MATFCAVFNYSNGADREKDKSNDRFPSIVKNNSKEGLKLLKVTRQKSFAQIFRKVLTEGKLERTRSRIKIMLSAHLHQFFHIEFTISDLKRKYLF